MRHTIALVCMLLYSVFAFSQDFKFAVISDLHISPINEAPLEDLNKTINSINETEGIDFVLVLGDITEQGDKASLEKAKEALDKLKATYHAVSGNHDTKWSASGATAFTDVFGSEKFDFEHQGIRFIGFASGPIVRMMDGHVNSNDIFNLSRELSSKKDQPVIVATHYPLAQGDVDNWYEVTDMLRQYNIKAILSGHHHRNAKTMYDGIPAFVNRSTLKDRYDGLTGYNIYTVTPNNISVAEQKVDPELRALTWGEYSMVIKYYTADNKKFKRPDYSINNKYPFVKYNWSRNIYQTIYASPAANAEFMYFGDDNGTFYCFESKRDNEVWRYKTDGRIVGTADTNGKVVVFGSTDKTIYGLNARTGDVMWQHVTSEPVLGSATISGNVVYIGGSDGIFRALDVNTGSLKWEYHNVGNYIECKPLVYKDKVFFGAWDSYMYALNKNDGNLVWQWKSENEGMHFSPAAVWPVASGDKVFFTAPDRYMTALNINTGDVVWRTNESSVRESIGISEDGQRVYSKTMQDSVICYSATADTPQRLWATKVGFGSDHAATMLTEKGGNVFGSTKNGIIFSLNGKSGQVIWQHKIGNGLIGTVIPQDAMRCLYVNSNGNVGLVEGRRK